MTTETRSADGNHALRLSPLGRRGLIATGLALSQAAATNAAFAAGPPVAAPPGSATALRKRLLPGFEQRFIRTDGTQVNGLMAEGAVINTLVGGNGPPLILIHGYPENHLCWHKVVGELSKRYTLVLPDLRGYGDSTKPGTSPQHVNYAKPVMAADLMQVMHALGFQAVGHDRGGRVLQFMMLDNPHQVTRGVMLDIVPSDLMYASMNKELGTKYFWWFFQVQEEPLPEDFMNALPDYYVRSHFGIQDKTGETVPADLMADYVRTCGDPASVHAVCEDFRAGAGIDSRMLEDNRKTGRKIIQPLLTVWGSKGTIGQSLDVSGLWREEAANVSGSGLSCGHVIHEEDPVGLLKLLEDFLAAD